MAIYKRDQGFELGTTENKPSKLSQRDSNPGPPECESDALTTWPTCLPNNSRIVLISLFYYLLIFQYEY